MATKMDVKAQAAVRASLYEAVANAMVCMDYVTEPFKDGLLVALGDGQYAKVNVAIANAEKFDVNVARAEYAEVLAKRAERAQKAQEKAAEKARKAQEKAEKAAEKAAN